MQVPPIPTTVLTNVVQPDVVAKTVPHIQAQAAAPLVQRAIDPAARRDQGPRTRTNDEKAKGGDRQAGSGKTDKSVDMEV